jgi:hypothetical protein
MCPLKVINCRIARVLYLRKLIANDRVSQYLAQYQPELLIEFQKIAEMTSVLPGEAA